MRFGREAVQFYTWIGMLFKIVAMGVALYSFATLVSSLIALSPSHLLADPQPAIFPKLLPSLFRVY
jgi:hypothetical protein